MQELTAGQASTMARNEQVIETMMEEVDDLDELLNDSIMDSIGARRKAKEAVGKAKKRKRAADNDDSDLDGWANSCCMLLLSCTCVRH